MGGHYGRLTHVDDGCNQHTRQTHELVGGALAVEHEEPSGLEAGLTLSATRGALRSSTGFVPAPGASPYRVLGANLWGGYVTRYTAWDLGLWGLTSPESQDAGMLVPWLTVRAGDLTSVWFEGELGPRDGPVGAFLLAGGVGVSLLDDGLHLRLMLGQAMRLYVDQRPAATLGLVVDDPWVQARLDVRWVSRDGWGVAFFTALPDPPAAGLSLSLDLDRL